MCVNWGEELGGRVVRVCFIMGEVDGKEELSEM